MRYLWVVYRNKRVMCLDIKLRKWRVQKNTLKEHECPGCLVSHYHLFFYIFSENGVERRITNDDYSPWETVQTNI